MKIVYAKEFAKEFKKLPVGVQRLYRKQENLFRENLARPKAQGQEAKGPPPSLFIPNHSLLPRPLSIRRLRYSVVRYYRRSQKRLRLEEILVVIR